MALARRSGQRFSANIWPGFVDAMTALLLVLIFVLSVFMIVQFVLRETILNQDDALDQLGSEIATLADALGLEQRRSAALEGELGAMTGLLEDERAASAAAAARIGLLEGDLATQAAALAETRTQLDEAGEAARLEAARRAAIEAMVAEMEAEAAAREASLAETGAALAASRAEAGALSADVADLRAGLSEAEQARLAEAAAAERLRARLADSDAELTAMSLALEAARKEAEETLTLLAGAQAARDAAQMQAETALTAAESRAQLLALADAQLAEADAQTAEDRRRLALLNQQTAALRSQLGSLQGLLDDAASKDTEQQVQIETLAERLNAALARAAAEQRRRAELEAAERQRLEAETQDLARYRSEFFGRLREVLGGMDGVRVVGDRFVFDSQVLFPLGESELSDAGRDNVARVAGVIREAAADIPADLDWIIRVDGHTDDVPVREGAAFADNWELSQARALSVVRYLIDAQGVPPARLAATGFGEFHPINPADTEEARAENRRIELKLTEQ